MSPIDLVFVGGFLGAGKTTWLAAAARALRARGRTVGLITNDQAAQLFDTTVLSGEGPVEEVAGSCFCCDFDGLMRAVGELRDRGVDIVLAEPVGSCTDLSATLVHPIRQLHAGTLRVAPLTVLVDPERLAEVRDGGLHEATAYIFDLQLAEADRVLLTKRDAVSDGDATALSDAVEAHLERAGSWVSALDGTGLDDWLDAVLTGAPAGETILEVDYDRYALGEAVLGWLNATVAVDARPDLVVNVVEAVGAAIGAAPVGHVKAVLHGDGFQATAQQARTGGPVTREGEGTPTGAATLVLNARVQCPPEALEAACRAALDAVLGDDGGGYSVITLDCFAPAYPTPTHRADGTA